MPQKEKTWSQAWWCTPVIPALGRLRQEDHKFQTSLGYTMRPCPPKSNILYGDPSLVLFLRVQYKRTGTRE
jgi:hypothetical protein